MIKKFPTDFIWGTATSSYQIEGAHFKDGKGLNIWDVFSKTNGKTANGDTGDIACDHYHLYKEDIAMMAKLGMKAYRFSISWARVMPNGYGKVNEAGIAFYSDLIDTLLQYGITPWVTLYHWDLPLALQMEHDGWLNPKIADFFAKYAQVCFEAFGDRVKHWITINEPWVVAILGYGQGVFAPGRISKDEPYIAGHHILLAHAKAVDRYRKSFAHQEGKIGITNNCDWREPLTDKEVDREAAERALLFFLGWFADPIYLGDYPDVMKNRLGERLPEFTPEEKKLLLGSSDFFGLNHYTTMYASDVPLDAPVEEISVYGNGGIFEDQYVKLTVAKDWSKTAMGWAVVPWGLQKLLEWIHQRYDSPSIIITENGCAYEDVVNSDGNCIDEDRISYVDQYLNACHTAIQNGVHLNGYFLWSLFDNFEWASGYEKRFGMVHVDFDTLQRTPKASAYWYQQVMEQNGILDSDKTEHQFILAKNENQK